MDKDYLSLLQQMREGTVTELEVKPEEFMDFQAALIQLEFRQRIVGAADRGGVVTYHYDRS